MSSKRVFYILAGLLGLLTVLGIAGMTYGLDALKRSADNLNEQKLETSVIDAQQEALTQAKRDIEAYAELEQIARTVVPQEKDQARTVREIIALAQQTGVPITSLTFPNSELGADQTKDSKSKKKSDDASESQLVPVEDLEDVYQMEITIQNSTTSPARYTALVNFLRALEQNRRTSQVTSVGLQPDPNNRNLFTYTMTIAVYIKPEES